MAGILGQYPGYNIGNALSRGTDAFMRAYEMGERSDARKAQLERQKQQDAMQQQLFDMQKQSFQTPEQKYQQSIDIAKEEAKIKAQYADPKPVFGGTGVSNQAMNYAITLRPKIESGQASPQEQAIYNMSVQQLTKPQVIKAPDGTVYERPGIDISRVFGGGQPAAQQTTSAQPTGPNVLFEAKPEDVKPVPVEKTRMLALSQSGLRGLDAAEKLLFDAKGQLNTSLLYKMKSPSRAAITSGALGEDASMLYSALVGAVRDKLRLESGAAIPVEEAAEEALRFMPGPFDTEKTAKFKLNSIRQVLQDQNMWAGIGVEGADKQANTQTQQTTNNDPLGLFGE